MFFRKYIEEVIIESHFDAIKVVSLAKRTSALIEFSSEIKSISVLGMLFTQNAWERCPLSVRFWDFSGTF